MNHLRYIEFDGTTVFAFAMAALVLILQLLLCYKTKKKLIQLLPMILLAISTVVFCVLSACIGGWDAFGYLFFAILSFGLLFVCGVVWVIWAIGKK